MPVPVGRIDLRQDAWRLLSRATFGPTPEELDRVLTLGREAWLEEQLDPAALADPELDAALVHYPWLAHSAAQLKLAHPGGGWSLSRDLRAVRLLRARLSRRQLFERTVELWTDRFNVPFSAQDANFLRPVFDREVIRARAFGPFPALLTASAKSPAMLAYLDADESVAGAPNENYARELLELHSLGSDGGYTESDVRELARVLTGWGYVRHWQPGEFGTFRFDAPRHDNGPKAVLGLTFPGSGGVAEGDAVLAHLGTHFGTARSVARAIVHHFVGYSAPAALVDELALAYRRTGGDVRVLLRLALAPEVLALAPPKVKRPFEFVVSLLRATQATITDAATAVSAMEGLGQTSFAWPTPDGYPDDPDAWSAMLYSRFGLTAAVTTGWNAWCGLRLADLQALIAPAPRAQWARAVAIRMFGRVGTATEVELASYVQNAAPPRANDLAEVFELAASSPDFQVY